MNTKNSLNFCMLGACAVGKSCLVNKYILNEFNEELAPTFGLDYHQDSYEYGNRTFTVTINDTAGQERFSAIIPNYYRNSHGVILVYDVTNRKSFERAVEYVEVTKKNGVLNDKIVYALVGNKSDLDEIRQIDKTEAQEYVDQDKDVALFFETSAKTGDNVKECFEAVIEAIIESHGMLGGDYAPENNLNTVNFANNTDDTKKKKCCVK